MQSMKDIKTRIHSAIKGGKLLIVVPPFGSISDITFGPHILQALAQEKGFKTDILYLNLLLAAIIGTESYERIFDAPNFAMLGERFFARSAHGLPPLGLNPEYCDDEAMSTRGNKNGPEALLRDGRYAVDKEGFKVLEEICFTFIEEASAAIASSGYSIVGCSAMMEQVNGSIALLKGLKKHNPDIITIMGGGNCEGTLAEGTATLTDDIDYIFSGESEHTLLDFLNGHSNGQLPPRKSIISSKPLENLDVIPMPDYSFFFEQYEQFFGAPAPSKVKVWYESSRGCWWADTLKCTYCGILHLAYRQKSTSKTLEDLKEIHKLYPGKIIYMIDSTMPRSFHRELLPHLIDNENYPGLGYQIRANLGLQEVVQMKRAKIDVILPGIESFSTGLLNLMHKGVSGRQNILFLRHARSAGIFSDWLLLTQFPGDSIDDYYELKELLPLIQHLQPPRKMGHMLLMRFSPFYDNMEKYNISNARPWAVMNMIYPQWANIENLTSYFSADWPCEAHDHPEVIKDIDGLVEQWKKTWKSKTLSMKPFMEAFIVFDNRDIHQKSKTYILDYSQAVDIMTSRKYDGSANLQWAVKEKLGVVMDSWYVPLVIAHTDLLLELENEMKKQTAGNTERPVLS